MILRALGLTSFSPRNAAKAVAHRTKSVIRGLWKETSPVITKGFRVARVSESGLGSGLAFFSSVSLGCLGSGSPGG